jgi:hypothetical protein
MTDGAESLLRLKTLLPVPTRFVLDYFHVSMKLRHIDQCIGANLPRALSKSTASCRLRPGSRSSQAGKSAAVSAGSRGAPLGQCPTCERMAQIRAGCCRTAQRLECQRGVFESHLAALEGLRNQRSGSYFDGPLRDRSSSHVFWGACHAGRYPSCARIVVGAPDVRPDGRRHRVAGSRRGAVSSQKSPRLRGVLSDSSISSGTICLVIRAILSSQADSFITVHVSAETPSRASYAPMNRLRACSYQNVMTLDKKGNGRAVPEPQQ